MSRDLAGEADQAIRRLRASFGDLFVDWVLNSPSEVVSAEQAEVAFALDALVSSAPSELPARFALSHLSAFDQGARTSSLNVLRMRSGGALPHIEGADEDPVLGSILRVALDAFPELLMKHDRYDAWAIHSLNSLHGDAFRAAALADPWLARFADSDDLDSRHTLRSTGMGGTTQLAMLDGTLIQAAWSLALLDAVQPTFDDLLAKLPVVLSELREALIGEPTTCTGVASLTGVLLPDGAVINASWGSLRQARTSDHPPGHHLDTKTSMTLEGGEHVVISDVGDILLVTQVPYRISFRAMDDHGDWPDQSGQQELEQRIAQVRLAYLLSWPNDEPPVLLPVVRRFVDPLTQPGNYSTFDLHQAVSRTPTRLTADDVARWKEWIRRLDTIDMQHLAVVSSRLLRASAERRDPADALIDTVIVWEALFTAQTESVLRVSASIARLLEPAGDARQELERRVNGIYNTRSRLVHGAEPSAPRELAEASRGALEITRDLLRVLVRDRPDLIPLKSSDRSRRVLLE